MSVNTKLKNYRPTEGNNQKEDNDTTNQEYIIIIIYSKQHLPTESELQQAALDRDEI